MAAGAAESVERLAAGFEDTVAPVWTRDGALVFGDRGEGALYRYSPGHGPCPIPMAQPLRCSGLTADRQNRLVLCDADDRRIVRIDHNGEIAVIADIFEGRRLNGPSGLAYRGDGSLYFTDSGCEDGHGQLPFNGLYRLIEGRRLQLLAADLPRPAGLAFSANENFLYVGSAERDRIIWMRYKVERDGLLTGGIVFHNAAAGTTAAPPSGLTVDRAGNVLTTAPGGVWVLSPAGDRIAMLRTPEPPSGLAWGGDSYDLHVTAGTGLYRLRWPIGGTLK